MQKCMLAACPAKSETAYQLKEITKRVRKTGGTVCAERQ